MKKFFSELWFRITSDTPKFFKRLQKIGGALIGLKVALIAVPGLPAGIENVATQLAVIGGVIVAVSQVAVPTTPNP